MQKKWGKAGGVLLGLLMMSLTVGCGSSDSKINATESVSEDSSTGSVYENSAESETLSDAGEAGGDNSSVPEINTNIDYNRKIIKNGSIHIQTEHFNDSINKLTAYVQSLKGYIESSNIEGTDFYDDYATSRSASLTIRVPQKSFDTFMNKGGEFGNVSYLTSNSEDITGQYVDTETRMKALNIRKEHLLALLEQSGNIKDLFEIEKELGDVTYEIESLKGTLQNYDSLVDMSTIDVEIQEVGKIKVTKHVETFGDQMKATFNSSIEGVASFFKGLMLFIIALIPFLIILIPVGAAIYFIIRRRKQRLMHKEEHKENDKEEIQDLKKEEK